MRRRRFVVWFWACKTSDQKKLSVHPVGQMPPYERIAAGDPAPVLAPLTPPLPLVYAALLKTVLESRIEGLTAPKHRGFLLWKKRLIPRWARRWPNEGTQGRRSEGSETKGQAQSKIAHRRIIGRLRRDAKKIFSLWFDDRAHRLWGMIRESRKTGETRGESQDGRDLLDRATPKSKPKADLAASAREAGDHALHVLEGRSLLTDELERALAERGVIGFSVADGTVSLDDILDQYVHEGSVERIPAVAPLSGKASFHASSLPAGVHRGIEKDDGRCLSPEVEDGDRPEDWHWQCRRCFSFRIKLVPCHRCGFHVCPRCLSCDSLGVATGCAPLYHRRVGENLPDRDVKIDLPFRLSVHQERVARDMSQSDRDALIWAACGAGKTETVLEPICRVLQRGGRVLFAVPRRDVVVELGERLSQALIGTDVAVLSGETPYKYASAPLVVSTVHQAVRFQDCFDLVVVDEVDAFPLSREPWLLNALQRAKRADGRFILMTATPGEVLLNRIRMGKLDRFTLPERPHGHPLPVPVVVSDPEIGRERVLQSLKTRRRNAAPFAGWVPILAQMVRECVDSGRRVIVFVPSVRLSQEVRHRLEGYLKEGDHRLRPTGNRNRKTSAGARSENSPLGSNGQTRVKPNTDGKETGGRARVGQYGRSSRRIQLEAVSAADPMRREKIDMFSRGQLDVLVSTTILERGITVSGLDVIVFMADDEPLFDAATLIQMAGRVGRRAEDPTGRVIFLAARQTPAMTEAIETIEALNRLAQEAASESLCPADEARARRAIWQAESRSAERVSQR